MALVQAHGLTKTFRRPQKDPGLRGSLKHLVQRRFKEHRAVDGIDLSIEAGEAVAYVGPNGAGKSTTIKLLTGILVPTSGSVTVAGLTPHRDRMRNARNIGVLFGQRSRLWTVLIGLILLVSAGLIHLSVIMVTNPVCFWIPGPYPFLAVAVHNAEDMIRYPLSIYGLGLRLAFTVLLPFAFITYFPVSWLLGRDQAWLGLLTPAVAIYSMWIARTVFRRGLRRYESAGH